MSRGLGDVYKRQGLDNREAAVRACSPLAGMEAATTTVEYKPCVASASPYLALGGAVAAGLDGVERKLEPPPPATVDPAGLSARVRADLGIERLPRSPAEALDALEADRVLVAALGEPLARTYLAVRRAEWEHDRAADAAADARAAFLRY